MLIPRFCEMRKRDGCDNIQVFLVMFLVAFALEVMMVTLVLSDERAVVSTLAGGVSGTNGAYADAPGTNAGFNKPGGVAVDASGNLFVADTYNQRIRKMTAGGGTLL